MVSKSNLFAWYKFDETTGSSAADSSGNTRTGNLNGGYSHISSGKIGYALGLDGSSGYVVLPSGMLSSVSDFTVTAWVYLNANYTWNRIFDFGSGTGSYMFLSPMGGGGKLRYAITVGTGEQIVDGTSALPTGSWQHVAVTQSGSTCTLYVNGTQVGQNAGITNKPSGLGSTTQTWIGRSQWPDPYFNGNIDDFRIYSRALSAGEVATISGKNIYTISGTVKNSSNSQAIPGATVWISSSPTPYVGGTSTTADASGNYSFTMIAGTYYLAGGAPNYSISSDVQVNISNGNAAGIDVLLSAPTSSALVSLDASGLANGSLNSWLNTGTAGGAFVANGTYKAVVTTLGGPQVRVLRCVPDKSQVDLHHTIQHDRLQCVDRRHNRPEHIPRQHK